MKDQKNVIKFLITALGLCLAWFLLYDFWLSDFDPWLAQRMADGGTWLLKGVGYSATTEESVVMIGGEALVYVGAPCNGMVLMALFTGFIMAFPGPFLKKLLYIPFGIIVINILNVIRVAALALIVLYYPEALDFNHKYTFTIIVYSIIFLLWMLWVKRFSYLNSDTTTTTLPIHHAA